MKFLCFALLFSTHFMMAQKNIAIFHAEKTGVSVSAKGGDMVSIAPFTLVNGMVIVKASIDGILGNYLLDTGSPGIVINTVNKKKNKATATGIGGAMEIGITTVHNFKWGIIEKKKIDAYSLDISHLEKAIELKLAGLIGYELLQGHEIYFDYPNSVIRMYSDKKAKTFRRKDASIEIPFFMNGHIPVISVKVGNKTAYLGLDSGAEANLLDDNFIDYLGKKYLSNRRKELLVGLDQKEQTVVSAKLQSGSIKNMALPKMKFLFVELEDLSEQFDSRFDGLLGFPFFEQHAVSINYRERKIYIWD